MLLLQVKFLSPFSSSPCAVILHLQRQLQELGEAPGPKRHHEQEGSGLQREVRLSRRHSPPVDGLWSSRTAAAAVSVNDGAFVFELRMRAVALGTMLLRKGMVRLAASHAPRFRQMSGSGYTMDQVKQMRAITSAPMKECVKALKATEGNIEEAMAWLRKAGVASAHKKAARQASDGAVVIATGETGLACVEVNTETDFVARNTVFSDLAASVARSCFSVSALPSEGGGAREIDVAVLGSSKLASGQPDAPSVSDALAVAMTQLGENIVLRRACLLPTPAKGVLSSYVHNEYSPGLGRIGAAVALSSEASDRAALDRLGQQLCMHIVAAHPLAVSRDDIPPSRIEREREILLAQAEGSGKPAQMIDKMVTGRLNKYFQVLSFLLHFDRQCAIIQQLTPCPSSMYSRRWL
jgi:elongation factor Ts